MEDAMTPLDDEDVEEEAEEEVLKVINEVTKGSTAFLLTFPPFWFPYSHPISRRNPGQGLCGAQGRGGQARRPGGRGR